jgi:hypothetical protein
MRTASLGSSSFHGVAKQGSYPIRVWRFNTEGLERVLDLHFALSEVPNILVEIRRTVGFQPLQSSAQPTFGTGTDCGEFPLDGDLGKIIHRYTQRLRGPFKVTESLIAVEVKCKNSPAHGLSPTSAVFAVTPGKIRSALWFSSL